MSATFTADARVLRALFKNAAAFTSDDKSRPILGGALVSIHDTGDGAATIRTVSTDSYGLLVQTLEQNAQGLHPHRPTTEPVLVDPAELVKLIPARKGSTAVEFDLDTVRTRHVSEGERAGSIVVPGEYPNWRTLLDPGIGDARLEHGVIVAHRNMARFRDIVDPQHGTEPGWALHQRAGDPEGSRKHPIICVASPAQASTWRAVALLMPWWNGDGGVALQAGAQAVLDHVLKVGAS